MMLDGLPDHGRHARDGRKDGIDFIANGWLIARCGERNFNLRVADRLGMFIAFGAAGSPRD